MNEIGPCSGSDFILLLLIPPPKEEASDISIHVFSGTTTECTDCTNVILTSSKRLAWDIYGTSMRHLWDIRETSIEHPCIIHDSTVFSVRDDCRLTGQRIRYLHQKTGVAYTKARKTVYEALTSASKTE